MDKAVSQRKKEIKEEAKNIFNKLIEKAQTNEKMNDLLKKNKSTILFSEIGEEPPGKIHAKELKDIISSENEISVETEIFMKEETKKEGKIPTDECVGIEITRNKYL